MRTLAEKIKIGIKFIDVAKLLSGRRQRRPSPRVVAHLGVNVIREHALGLFSFLFWEMKLALHGEGMLNYFEPANIDNSPVSCVFEPACPMQRQLHFSEKKET